MSNAVTHIFTPTTFPAIFARNTRLGLYPLGIEKSSQITWSSDYQLVEAHPVQTLLEVPSLRGDNAELSRSMDPALLRLEQDLARRRQSVKGPRRFAKACSDLQREIDVANRSWRGMSFPGSEINLRAGSFWEKRTDEKTPADPHAVGREALHVAVMLLEGVSQSRDECIDDKSKRNSVETAAHLFQISAGMYAKVLGPDAKALLTDLAYAAYTKFISMSDRDYGLYGRYNDNLSKIGQQTVDAWTEALGIQQEPAFDSFRILGGVRACLSSPDHYRSMIGFLKRNAELYDASPENDLRMAWAYIAGPQASHQDWDSAVLLMDKVIAKWKKDPARSDQFQKLTGLRNSVQVPDHSPKEPAVKPITPDKKPPHSNPLPDSGVRVIGERNEQLDSQMSDSTILR